MSGLCGILRHDGAPVDAGLLRAMTRGLAFRGPERQDCRLEGGAGLGHALLQATAGTSERQPLTLDGRTWITADARVDDRGTLVRALRGRGREVAAGCPDAGLILHAWHAWGERCVEHLLGDFAFAIWDRDERRLFAAVDHFGVKPFFYAQAGVELVFANTLDTVRAHPAVSGDLDELAIADFLLFELNQDPASTAFAAIRRLPAAGYLVAANGRVRTGTYWELPEARVRYRRGGDYVEHFREVFTEAVIDRLRGPRIGVSMSGGLDSPAIAATARAALARAGGPFDLRAHTVVYDRVMRDEERHFAGIAAAALSIPIHYYPADDLQLYEGFGVYAGRFPDPFHAPDVEFGSFREAALLAPVLLTGMDGDMILHESPKPYFRSLWAARDYGRLAAAVARYALAERRVLPRAWLAARGSKAGSAPRYPGWLEPAFEARLGLRERWESVNTRSPQGGGVRPHARRYLLDTLRLRFFFDQYDAGVTGVPLEVRHPFLDRRVVESCLSLPPTPWCVRKCVLRAAMRGVLPEAILRRPKTPLAKWPGADLVQLPQSRWIDDFEPQDGLDRYVVRGRIPPATRGGDPLEAWMNLRPLTLSLWLGEARGRGLPTRSMEHETA